MRCLWTNLRLAAEELLSEGLVPERLIVSSKRLDLLQPFCSAIGVLRDGFEWYGWAGLQVACDPSFEADEVVILARAIERERAA